jgi:hypothetical protein
MDDMSVSLVRGSASAYRALLLVVHAEAPAAVSVIGFSLTFAPFANASAGAACGLVLSLIVRA